MVLLTSGARRSTGSAGRQDGRTLDEKACALALFALFLPLGLQAQELALLRRPPDRDAVARLDRAKERSTEPVTARWNPLTGRVRSLSGRFELDAGRDLAEAARVFLESQRDLLGWPPLVELRRVHGKDGIGSRHLRFRAYLGDVPLSSGEVSVHVDLSRGDERPPAITYLTSSLPAEEALGGIAPLADFLSPRIDGGRAVRVAENAVSRAVRRPSTARLEVLASAVPARLVYTVQVPSAEPPGLFKVWVDARSGEVLFHGDLRRYGLGQTRDGVGDVFLVNPVVDLRNPDLEDMDDSADAVPREAYREVVLRELDGTGMLTGPYVTTAQTPNAVRRVRLQYSFLRDDDAFEEVMIYHHIDSAQRFIQSLGFDNIYNRRIVAYANAQPPGIPYTEVQAFFAPNFDVPGTGEMAFGSGGVDLAEDAEVIIHEYGHATQLNQVPFFVANFESLETFAIGEGWSDFFAASYLSAFSGGHGDVCLGEWAVKGFPEFLLDDTSCVRRLDSDKRYPQSVVGEPHADGEMWASSLWQAHEFLGREDALTLVLQSHFLLPENARFRDAVEAVLEANRQLYQGAHTDFLTGIFDDRGFLRPPPDSTWFYVSRPAGSSGTVPAFESRNFKFRLERSGNVAFDDPAALQVYLDLTHPLAFLLRLVLRSPSGTEVILHEAGFTELPPGPIIFETTLSSEEPLEILAGEPIAGVWTLQVDNSASFEKGVVSEWGLRFRGFLRGDADRDGDLGMNDAIVLLRYLFAGSQLDCQKAADFDDDGVLNVSDAVGWLLFLYLGGTPPPQPYPDPGEDLTEDSLSCDV